MTETKKRTLEDIRNEYSQMCAKAGHLQYQIAELSKDLGVMNTQLRDLNFEATTIVPSAPSTGTVVS